LSSMGYRTVFDVTQVGFQWWIPLLIGIFGAFFVGVGWAVRTTGDKDSFRKGALFQLVGAVGFLGALVFFVSMYWEYRSARKAFETHSYSVSEGVVRDFIPMPPGGHSTESFEVNGVRFEYGSGWGSTMFNSEWNKGFIHNGVEVRITYVGKDIIKVEAK
jgi:hypothetical protein